MSGLNADHSIEAEQAVLGALLIEEEAFDEIADVFRPELFWLQAHQEIAAAMLALKAEQKPIDPVMLHQRLQAAGAIPDRVPADLPFGLTKGLGTAGNVRHYADELRNLWLRRAVKLIAQDILRSDASERGEVLISRIADKIASLETRAGKPPRSLNAVIIERLEEIGDQHKHQTAPEGVIATGYRRLDELIGGLRVGHLTTIAARPGVGKSAFVSALADRVAARVPVCIFQLEDYADALADRAISRRAEIPSGLLRDGRFWQREHWDRVGVGVYGAMDLPIYVDDQHGRTVHDIAATMRRMARKHGCRVFILDNLSELILPQDGDRLDRELGKAARLFRDAAQALDAVPVLVVHLNRDSEKTDRPPRLSDLKNSGDIEDASHLVAMLSRNEKTPEVITFDVVKHRNGARGLVPLRWRPQFMAVEDAA